MADADLTIAPVSHRAVVRLRARSTMADQGFRLPPAIERQVRVLSFSPGEWFATSEAFDGAELIRRLKDQANDSEVVAVDLSSGLKVFRVEGAHAREL